MCQMCMGTLRVCRRRYDPERAKEAPDAPLKQRPSGTFMVLSVQMRTKQHVTVGAEQAVYILYEQEACTLPS